MRKWNIGWKRTQKNKISMAFKFILFSTILIASSCGTTTKSDVKESDEKTFVVRGTIQTHSPYCGGARPTPEMEEGFDEPVKNADFYIYSEERPQSAKDMTKVTTDEEGKFTVSLPTGNYSIIQASKLLPLEEFIAQKSMNSEQYVNSSSSCFESWKNSPDFTFNVESEDCSPSFTELKRCFTGANPCIKYTGPYPP